MPAQPRLRLVLFALVGLLALLLGFVVGPDDGVARWIQMSGYGVMVALTVGWGYSLWQGARVWRRALGAGSAALREPWWRRRRVLGAVLGLAALSGLMHVHFPHQFKVLNDEAALLGTSLSMHKTRAVFVPVQAFYMDGALRLEGGYVDKRPFFFPFVVSLMHDATGYRMANPIILNALLTPVLFAMVVLAGRAVGGKGVGWLAAWLLASLPLLGQNLTSGGFEILNLLLILAVMVLGGFYLRKPSPETLLPLVFTAAVLAYTRYESILFVLPVGLIVVLGWVRSRRVVLPAAVYAVPLLLVPIPWLMRAVQSNYAAFFQLADLKVDTAFSIDYFATNLASATRYLLHTGGVHMNSVPLTVVGLLGVVVFVVSLLGRLSRRESLRPMELSFALIGAGVLTNFLLLQCYHWGQAEDPIVARLTLPLHGVFAVAAAWLIGQVASRWQPVRGWALVGAVAACLYLFPMVASNRHLERVSFPILRQQATEAFIRNYPEADILVLADNPLNFIIGGIYAMPLRFANEHTELVRRYLEGGLVRAIYVTREYNDTLGEPDGYRPAARISQRFEVELIDEHFRQPGQRWQIYRLVAVRSDP